MANIGNHNAVFREEKVVIFEIPGDVYVGLSG